MDDYSAYIGIGHNSAIALKNEVVELAQEQLKLEQKVERLEEELKSVKEELRVLATEKLPEKMEELGITEFTTPDKMKIKLKEGVDSYVSEERREQANEWLEKNGHGGLIKTEVIVSFGKNEVELAHKLAKELQAQHRNATFKRSVHPMTLKAFVREQVAEGKDIPIETFGIRQIKESIITLKKERY